MRVEELNTSAPAPARHDDAPTRATPAPQTRPSTAGGVDFDAPVFDEHPDGWQSPADLVEGFLLAWSLEAVERRRINASAPYSAAVTARLPAAMRTDTFGQLVRLPIWAPIDTDDAAVARARLTTMCIAWKLFDQLNSRWQLRVGDFNQYAQKLSFATGETDRPSVFADLSAAAAKCLLADRITRASLGQGDLTAAERWFATGDKTLLLTNATGHAAIPFVIGGSPITLIGTRDLFQLSVWSCARVLADMNSPDLYIEHYRHRTPTLTTILDAGVSRFDQARRLPTVQALTYDLWPGWGGERA
ncbi:hypothetical protein [Cellulomonas xiejunii]|nr:hypothetical protein [Cellulomonas xiejunii]MCC2321179.1 hypothetical protein [Cellulomonas xiejunii]